jgi:cholesterol oxidase
MAMLAGLQGVRSAVSSQAGAHFRVLPARRARSGLHLDSLLDGLGVDSLATFGQEHDDWVDRLYDRALRLNPATEREERCDSAACHRITFVYGLQYEHDQLNPATHSAVDEIFGLAAMSHLRHLGALTRHGHLVTADGQDAYLPQVGRLAIPIAYIHGAENETWLPESTELTFNWLREHNDRRLYSRHLIANYGHLDCIIGQRAAVDVYPLILRHLEQTA